MNASTPSDPERPLRRAALNLHALLRVAGVPFHPARQGVWIETGSLLIEIRIGTVPDSGVVVVIAAEIPDRFGRADLEEALRSLAGAGAEGLAILDTADGCRAIVPCTPLDGPAGWELFLRHLRMLTRLDLELIRATGTMEQEAA